jgi:hypothetical protein
MVLNKLKCKMGLHKDIKEINRSTILWYGYNAFSHYQVKYRCKFGCKFTRNLDKNGNIKLRLLGV